MAVTIGKKPKAAAKKKALTFTIDCSKPVDDKIMEISSFEKFLEQKIKVRASLLQAQQYRWVVVLLLLQHTYHSGGSVLLVAALGMAGN